MPSLLDYYRPQPQNPFGPFNSRVTYYAPGPGDRMEGGFETSQPNPQTGKRVPSTLDDVRLGTSPFVTLAGDPSRYGQTVKMGPLTYTSPLDQKSYTIPDVTGYVHDTGSAFKGRPDKLDVAAGDYRGYSPQAASAAVTADAGRRTVTPLEGDEADRAMRPIGMPEPWRATGEGYDQTAVAQGPPPQQGRKMPTSLMDMFQPTDAAGEPADFGRALTSRSNSLIGLGLGLMRGPGMGEGLEGYQRGFSQDAAVAARQQQLAHQKVQEGRQAANDAFNRQQALLDRDLKERQFERSDPAKQQTDYQRALRDLYPDGATPEQKAELAKQIWLPKTEGNLAAQAGQRQTIAKNLGMDPADPKTRNWIAGGGALNEEGKPLPSETAAAIAMGGKFLDEAPAIRAKIASGMATDSLTGKVMTYFNAGEQGEVARKVKSGTEALLRALTGAGMGIAEAQKYVERYEIQPTDTSTGALSKFDQLQDELTRREQEAFRGRGGVPRDLLERRKAAHEAVGKPPTATATDTAPGGTPAPTAGRGGAAPARPANVPQGSYYSPSRNQWKLPDGTIVDAAGRPI